MAKIGFPEKFKTLEPFSDRFEAFRLAADGCDVLFASYPAGTEIEPHDHDTHNMGVVTKGTMYITVDGVETAYNVGEWYDLPAGVVHSSRCPEDTEEVEFWFKTE